MRIFCISDLHNYLPEIPDCDLLLIAGDINGFSQISHQCAFLEGAFKRWVGGIIGRGIDIVAVAGNHDWLMQNHPNLWKEIYYSYGYCYDSKHTNHINRFYYLEDSDLDYNGLKIFGTPGSLPFHNWAFNYPEEKIGKVLENAAGADIIISHGPPKGIADLVMRPTLDNVGSQSLLQFIDNYQPKLVVCGHIHYNHGIYQRGATKIISCSVVNESYEADKKHQPIMVEL